MKKNINYICANMSEEKSWGQPNDWCVKNIQGEKVVSINFINRILEQ